MKKIKTNLAFTLAEVLITLGIIGVVAAMTIPSLISQSEKQEEYAKMMKAYSILTQAATSIRSDNNGQLGGVTTTIEDFVSLFKAKFKSTSTCYDLTCWNVPVVKRLDGGPYLGTDNYIKNYPKIVTADNVVYIFGVWSANCDSPSYKRGTSNEGCSAVFVDINNSKAPNTVGKDIFIFSVNANNVTPYDSGSSGWDRCVITNTSDIANGENCAKKAIAQGAIKYY